jgi:GNAT superfamily N-acetyltransferase
MDLVTDVGIRLATIADAPVIAPFHLACWQAAYSSLVPLDFLDHLARQDRAQRWRERLSAPHDATFVAVVAGEIAGLATVGPSGEQTPLPGTELRSLYVNADYHGTGLAHRLVELAVAGQPASLWVFEGNVRARAFYAKTGWRPTGQRRIDSGTRIPELQLGRATAG